MRLHQDPDWPRASEWLAGDFSSGSPRLGVLGVPLNKSISPGRCDLAPRAIRSAMVKYSTFDCESAVDLRDLSCHDFGDLPVAENSPEMAFAPIRDGVCAALQEAQVVILLGGDNGVTRPGVHGFGVPLDRVGVITFDAHLDVRTTANGLHNGNPIRALIEDGLPGKNIHQIGIAPFTNSKAYWDFAVSSGCNLVTLGQVRKVGLVRLVLAALESLKHCEAIYIDLDVDVLDRAFSPGTPGARPGGLTPDEVAAAAHLCGTHPKVKLMDLVEIDPEADPTNLSSLAAARFLLAFASGVLQR